MTDINLAAASGRCSLCGCGIGSAAARLCVACERAHTHRCPTCVDDKGCLLRKYQRHRGCHTDQPCANCGVWHGEDRQLECPECKGERWVLRLPEGAAK